MYRLLAKNNTSGLKFKHLKTIICYKCYFDGFYASVYDIINTNGETLTLNKKLYSNIKYISKFKGVTKMSFSLFTKHLDNNTLVVINDNTCVENKNYKNINSRIISRPTITWTDVKNKTLDLDLLIINKILDEVFHKKYDKILTIEIK